MSLDLIKAKLIASGDKSILFLSFIVFIKFLCSLKYLFVKIPKADVLFLFSTKNQKEALTNTSKVLGEKALVANVSLSANIDGDYNFPIFFPYLFSVFFVPIILFEYIFLLSENEKIRLRNGFQDYSLALGNCVCFYIYLKIVNPKLIVLSNDHNSNMRILIYIAEKLKIKTVYIQHASVSNYFPPLNQFNLALLDGQYSKDIYSSIGSLPEQTFLVGVNKFDNYKRKVISFKNQEPQSKQLKVGIALNPLYCEAKLKKLVFSLQEQAVEIVIRLHPIQFKVASILLNSLKEFKFKLSDPIIEKPADFILNANCVIAGNSGILLETAILNKAAIYYDLDSIPHDYYQFVSNGIALELMLPDGRLIDLLSEYKEKTSMRINYYDHSFGNGLYGYSSECCSQKILQLSELENSQ